MKAKAIALAFGGLAFAACAETITWIGAGVMVDTTHRDWFDPTCWDLGRIPAEGDDVVINGATDKLWYIDLTNSTPHLSSLTLSHDYPSVSPHRRIYFFCKNWMTKIWADDIQIKAGAQIRAYGSFTGQEMSNRVWIVGKNLTMNFWPGSAYSEGKHGGIYCENSGYVAMNGPGYACFPEAYSGSATGFSGAYGGEQLNTAAEGTPRPYGDPEWPFAPGTGAYSSPTQVSPSQTGGGAVFIDLTGDFLCNGCVLANSTITSSAICMGSGGGIVIKCRTLTGSGLIDASAQAVRSPLASPNPGASGGRIAIHYDPVAQTNAMADCKVSVRAVLGAYGVAADAEPKFCRRRGSAGTIWLPDELLLRQTDTVRLAGVLANMKTDEPIVFDGDLSLTEGQLAFTDPVSIEVKGNVRSDATSMVQYGFDFVSNSTLKVAGDVTMTGSSVSFRNGGALEVGGDLTLRNVTPVPGKSIQYPFSTGGELALRGGEADATATVAGRLTVEPYSVLTPRFNDTEETICRIVAGTIDLQTNAYVDASGFGYSAKKGPGYQSGFGGTHGGRGADVSTNPTRPYGDRKYPTTAGSGGYPYTTGGGVIYLQALRDFVLNGATVAANGNAGSPGQTSYHGAAGGSILLLADLFHATNSVFCANGGDALGGDGNAYGGGGGRIAIRMEKDFSDRASLTFSVAGGTSGRRAGGIDYPSDPAEDGTVYWRVASGALILIR